MNPEERERIWEERIAEWQASGMSQQAFAIQQGFPAHQLGYWLRRQEERKPKSEPAMLPVEIKRNISHVDGIVLQNGRGWSITLPQAVPAAWLLELLRGL